MSDTCTAPASGKIGLPALGERLRIGDVVFIRVGPRLFRQVSDASACWANHVGIVITEGSDPVVAESRVPFACTTRLSRFVGRSLDQRVQVRRPRTPLSNSQRAAIPLAARRRLGTLYHTGFRLDSRRQFCSKFVREVLQEATGMEAGRVESFATLLAANPGADQRFWKWWFFGNIPWQRRTVTPASLLYCAQLHDVFDGHTS